MSAIRACVCRRCEHTHVGHVSAMLLALLVNAYNLVGAEIRRTQIAQIAGIVRVGVVI